MADEYVDAGRWQESSKTYRAVKWLERIGFERADQLVVLTRRMRDWIVEQGYAGAEKIEVIPCCVDFDRFNPQHDTADDGRESGGRAIRIGLRWRSYRTVSTETNRPVLFSGARGVARMPF